MVSTQFFIIGKIIVRPNLIFKRKVLYNHHLVQSFEKLGIFINVTSYTKQHLHNINYNLLILNAYIILVSYTFYSLFWGSFVSNGNRNRYIQCCRILPKYKQLLDICWDHIPTHDMTVRPRHLPDSFTVPRLGWCLGLVRG